MHRAATTRWLVRPLRAGAAAKPAEVAVLLGPLFGRRRAGARLRLPAVSASSQRRRWLTTGTAAGDTGEGASQVEEPPVSKVEEPPVAQVEAPPVAQVEAPPVAQVEAPPVAQVEEPPVTTRRLPVTCSGCGAFAQTDDPKKLGYFDLAAKRIHLWMNPGAGNGKRKKSGTDELVKGALESLGASKLAELGLDASRMLAGEEVQAGGAAGKSPSRSKKAKAPAATETGWDKAPICLRCHELLHYNQTRDSARLAVHHPSIEAVRDTIEESPYKYNHIYHVIDFADFPMSLIPRLNDLLGDIHLRSRNRRAQGNKFVDDRQTEMSFIITRSDLVASKKEMVDAMMPNLREILREALGRTGENVRLGNVWCVSAMRGWWIRALKEATREKGGAYWLVGKANVGKSQLFGAVFPKGWAGDGNQAAAETISSSDCDVDKLLPPLQPVSQWPQMPVVSPLHGTTASPIRAAFGNGKGEMIDMPGLARGDLERFVNDEHRGSLVWQTRIKPKQTIVAPGESLVLGGGLIRITPRTGGLHFLMCNFTPMETHLTSTEKAIEFQNQTRSSPALENLALPGIGDKMQHAGTFRLCYDVTKKRAGPLTRKDAVGLRVDRLPFRVLSLDILIEGVGFVEVAVQVRARDVPREDGGRGNAGGRGAGDAFAEMMSKRVDAAGRPRGPQWPAVDVFTPEGRFVGSRRPIEAWENTRRTMPAKKAKSTRQRKSMKGAKKKEKKMAKMKEKDGATGREKREIRMDKKQGKGMAKKEE